MVSEVVAAAPSPEPSVVVRASDPLAALVVVVVAAADPLPVLLPLAPVAVVADPLPLLPAPAPKVVTDVKVDPPEV